jgi:ABC-2 type transport system permease protein
VRRFFQRVLALSSKEVRHVVRDRRTLYLALGMPVMLLVLFGFGISFDIEHAAVAFVDHDRTDTSRELRRRMTATEHFDDVGEAASDADAERMLVRGEAIAIMVIPRHFERDLRRGRRAEIAVLVDGADANTAVQVRAKAESTLRVLAMSTVARGAAGRVPIEPRTFTRFNPEARSAVFLVPGLAAYVLALVAVMLTALTVSREWERGSMAQLFATPVGRFEIIIGKLLPYLVLGGIGVLLVIASGVWIFDVPFRGSPLAIVLLSFLFLAGMLGQGLFISVFARSQMVATQMATMSSMLPSLLLSGFMFPIENMPLPLQTISRAVPARYYVAGLRAVLLRGNGLGDVVPEIIALSIFALVMIVISTARFKRTIA